MNNEMYIVGPVSSGKSTFARRLSKELNIPNKSPDEVVHIPDKSTPWGIVKEKLRSGTICFIQ